ncbi:MAG: hypothetical protein K0R05_1749 [Anaerocolumna sp.]|jgi:hypothetical protein|nr:hypothetical protein [Anaerocolumna sp.]
MISSIVAVMLVQQVEAQKGKEQKKDANKKIIQKI